jgi:hypothetical protein
MVSISKNSKYQVKISNRFAALGNLAADDNNDDDDVVIGKVIKKI